MADRADVAATACVRTSVNAARRSERATSTFLLSTVVLCCAIAAGCGQVGEPLYPALRIPVRVTDLSAVERGTQIDISFTVPSQTTEGLTLSEVGKIELRIGSSAGATFDANRWAETAQPVNVETPTAPGFMRAQVPAQALVGKDEVIAVRVANKKGRFSDWSNVVAMTVEPPLPTPTDVKAEAAPQGVQLTWDDPGATQFRIYRKAPDQNTPALLATSDQASYVDSTAEYEKTYAYYVEGVHEKAVSVVAGPVSITPKDIFPPAVPSGVTASAGVGAVELAWERNTEPDFKEYRVLRAESDGQFSQVAAGLDAPTYSDHAVESGKRYRYSIISVDQNGNASQPSNPVEVTVP